MTKKEDLVEKYLNKGYVIIHENKKYATMKEQRHKFSWLAFILWTIFTGGIGFFGYILYHFVKSGSEMTVEK